MDQLAAARLFSTSNSIAHLGHTYHAERHPVGARVLHSTMAQVALSRTDARTEAVRDTMTDLLGMDEPRKRIAGMLSGLDVHCDLGEGHPLLGRRMPDLDLVTAGGAVRVFTLLHAAQAVLLNLESPGLVIPPRGRTECWRSTRNMAAIGSFRPWVTCQPPLGF
jgi:hypothetical protein